MAKYIMLLGAPNSGKGTACRQIAEEFDIFHLSTGDLIRDNIVSGTLLGLEAKKYIDKGELVPDNLIINLVKDKIENDFSCQDGVVFDGFPRTLFQAQQFDKIAHLDAVVFLDVKDETVIERAVNRRVCPNCKKIFSLKRLKGKEVCDVCKSKLITREDGNPEFANKRLMVYKELTLPLIDYYGDRLIKIDANREFEEVNADIIAKLKEVLK